VKPLAEYWETRTALILALRDHDEWLRANHIAPGKDRAIMVGSLQEMGVEAWTFEEGTWVK
jgi:hypothetical protein